MNLSREIFWDTNYNTINWNKHRQWVICRVLEYGSLNDWKQIKKKALLIKYIFCIFAEKKIWTVQNALVTKK